MRSDTVILLVIVWGFWTVWWLLAVAARRSYIPVVPLYPLAFLGTGYLLDKVYPWAGTFAVGAIHLVLAAGMVRAAMRKPPGGNGSGGAAP